MDNGALKNEFLIESFENLSTINEDLTQIEKEPTNKNLLNKLYRTVHTMKGSASFLGYKVLQDITHSAENLLDALREEKFLINSDIIDTLLETFDICHLILKNLESSDVEGDVEINTNKASLEHLLNTSGKIEQSSPVPESEIADSEVNAAESDFSEGVQDDGELGSLIEGHRSIFSTADEEEKLIEEMEKPIAQDTSTKTSPEPESSDDNEGLSSAALDSLKELIGDGKIDPHVLEELQADFGSSEGPPAEKSTQVEEKPVEINEPAKQALFKEAKPAAEVKEEVKPEVKPAVKPEVKPEPQVPKTQKETGSKGNTTSAAVIDDNRKSIADSFVRVNVKVLDKIMNIVGELVLNRNQILQFSNQREDHEFSKLAQQLNTITSELQSEVMSTRMQPIGSILTKFERLVRDFSRQNSKSIVLKLSGQETELDKTLIEAIKDPLVHIIRNACDHGMETIEERENTTKPKEGTIHIKSYNESGQVTVEIVDDGRGLNREKIGLKAIEKGVITQEKYESMTDNQVYNLIFAPGFSTAEKITNISGRGVGMDVVKTNIEKIGGSVVVTSEFGVGTTFKLRIPLTLAIVPALIIKSNNESFAIPQLNLVELVRLETEEDKSAIEKIQGSEFLKLRGDLTPVFRLSDELSLQNVHEKRLDLENVMNTAQGQVHSEKIETKSQFTELNKESYNIVILSAENRFFGIIVDEILDTEEIVVKPLSTSLKQLSLFGGATIMGDGKVALILDALGFLSTVQGGSHSITSSELNFAEQQSQELVDGSEVQENLLFKLFDNRDYAVPLSLVSRLEEFPVKNIEFTGNQPIVRYLNAPMPLINIEKTLRLNAKSALENYKDNGVEALSCIVTTIQGKHFGLIVKEVNDISIDKVIIDNAAVDREGILGTVFIQDRTISLVDLYSIIEAQNIGGIKLETQKHKSSHKGKKVLIVDDSPMYRKMESDLLESMGFEVVLANHGEDAFEVMKSSNFDLLITDIEMPFLNGYELAKKVREELDNQVIPILALSTRFSEEDINKGKEHGFNFHMEKFKKFEVADKVVEILGEN